MSDKLDTLDVRALLKKNPKAARVFAKNRKKLGAGRQPRRPKEYGLGLPYARPALANNGNERNQTDFKTEFK